jgi:hypothetical protein
LGGYNNVLATGVTGSIYMIGLLRNLTNLNAPFGKTYMAFATYILWFFQILSLVEAVAYDTQSIEQYSDHLKTFQL